MTARKTETRLADGRALYYFDSADVVRDAKDTRDLPPTTTSSEIRWDPLLDQWVVIASHRQARTYLPPADECPLDPSRDGRQTEIPADDYEVVVFENRFPSLSTGAVLAGRTTVAPNRGPTATRCSPGGPGSAGARWSASPATTRRRSRRCRRSGSRRCSTRGSTAPRS